MAEVLSTGNIIYPGVPIRDDINIYVDEELNCIVVRDSSTEEKIIDLPLNNGPI